MDGRIAVHSAMRWMKNLQLKCLIMILRTTAFNIARAQSAPNTTAMAAVIITMMVATCISAPNVRGRTVPIVRSSMFVKGVTKLIVFNAELK
mmetsp:Transcript_15149/g.21509  ORF Transcript_15149/g.21509 Transcript_15149/m.21509 type:complete len:92 (-) Transcript_15149:632-907(-)